MLIYTCAFDISFIILCHLKNRAIFISEAQQYPKKLLTRAKMERIGRDGVLSGSCYDVRVACGTG